jgi:YD repeat-containing protein
MNRSVGGLAIHASDFPKRDWELTQFQYEPWGNLTNLVDGKSQSTKWAYDEYGRVTNKVDALGTEIFRYSYDLNNHNFPPFRHDMWAHLH